MKKVLLFAGVLFMFSATSCKKDYTCSCAGYTDGTLTVEPLDFTIEDSKKKDAEDACAEMNVLYSSLGSSCALK